MSAGEHEDMWGSGCERVGRDGPGEQGGDYHNDALCTPFSPPCESPDAPPTRRPTDAATADARRRACSGRARPGASRQSHELQALGEALARALPTSSSRRSASPSRCATRCRAARRIRSHEARRRQMQLIGKLMRSADVEPLARAPSPSASSAAPATRSRCTRPSAGAPS